MNHETRVFLRTSAQHVLAATAILALGCLTGCRSTRGIGRFDPNAVQQVTTHRDRLSATTASGAAAAADPEDLGPVLRMSQDLVDAGRACDAAELLERCQAAHHADPHWLTARAASCTDPAQKLSFASRALQLSPDLLAAVEQVAIARSMSGQHAEAAAQFARCSDLDPFDNSYAERQAIAWAAAGQRFRAVLCYWNCICREFEPGSDRTQSYHAALASLYEANVRWPGASGWFRSRAGAAPGLQELPADTGPELPPPPAQNGELGLLLGGASGYEAILILPGATAAAAGVRLGDTVRSIGGEPVPADIDPWRRAHWLSTRAAPGQSVTFQVVRAGEAMACEAIAIAECEVLEQLMHQAGDAAELERTGQPARAATAWAQSLQSMPVNRASLAGAVRAYEMAGQASAAIAMLEVYERAFPQSVAFAIGLGERLARHGSWDRLDQLMQGARQRFPASASIAALEGLALVQADRVVEAHAAFERSLTLREDGTARELLATRLDQRETALRVASAEQAWEERRRAFEREEAERKRRGDMLGMMLLMRMAGFGGAGSSGAGSSGAATGYQYTGPNHLQQWSNQEMQNGMWAHNMGR